MTLFEAKLHTSACLQLYRDLADDDFDSPAVSLAADALARATAALIVAVDRHLERAKCDFIATFISESRDDSERSHL